MTIPMVHFFVFLSIYRNNNSIMKHLLNNLSEEEKNSIREQHEGGMKVSTEKFNLMVEKKLGEVKPYQL